MSSLLVYTNETIELTCVICKCTRCDVKFPIAIYMKDWIQYCPKCGAEVNVAEIKGH